MHSVQVSMFLPRCLCRCFFFFNDTATTEIYTLSLHDALPISNRPSDVESGEIRHAERAHRHPEILQRCIDLLRQRACEDRKSTRLNSSHSQISYAVFRLKKKTINNTIACAIRTTKSAHLLEPH